MRVLVVVPHFFGEIAADRTNKSRREDARGKRVAALSATITWLHYSLGDAIYGLDHDRRVAWHAGRQGGENGIDVVICTTGASHVPSHANPAMLGFECHEVLKAHNGKYDYFCYVEDDIVITDAMALRKRRAFDRQFPSSYLLQPNRFEVSARAPIRKLYVDYRANVGMTALYQDVGDSPALRMPYGCDSILFERSTYPSAGCFMLSGEQLDRWTASPYFSVRDVSYLSPLDSAATLSVMRTFQIYKPALQNAWFFEVMHASPRWIASAPRDVSIASSIRDNLEEE
jgi:hypothetical protein